MAIPPELAKRLQEVRRAGQRVVLVTGVFDILHQEHQQFLTKAKAEGDFLVVGIESDQRVRAMKGEGRPINPQSNRVAAVSALKLADAVFVLPEQFSQPADHALLISEIRPAVLAVSSHTKHLDKKQAILAQFGGEVKVVHDHNPAVSTTLLLAERQRNVLE